MADSFPFSPSSPELWLRRLTWATHTADVRFVEASMSANRLVDQASAAANTLRSSTVSPQVRDDVRAVLEATVRRLVPLERKQGACLHGLGRTMLSALRAMYLGLGEEEDGASEMGEEEADRETAEVPENELVRETRQVLIRGELRRGLVTLARTLLTLPSCSSCRPVRERLRIVAPHA